MSDPISIRPTRQIRFLLTTVYVLFYQLPICQMGNNSLTASKLFRLSVYALEYIVHSIYLDTGSVSERYPNLWYLRTGAGSNHRHPDLQSGALPIELPVQQRRLKRTP